MAQGVYHVFNFAKMRLLKAVYQSYPNAVTTKEIAEITGMEHGKVSRLLTHYHNHNYQYFRRLKKKDINGGYRYKLNKKGVKAMLSFILRNVTQLWEIVTSFTYFPRCDVFCA